MPKQYEQVMTDERSVFLCPLLMLRGLEDQRCVGNGCMWFDQIDHDCLVARETSYIRDRGGSNDKR